MREIPRDRLIDYISREVQVRTNNRPNNSPLFMSRGITRTANEIADYWGINPNSVARSLRRFLNGGDYIRFNTADQWLIALGLQNLWYTELSDLYFVKDVNPKRSNASKKMWANRTDEEKKIIGQKISQKLRARYVHASSSS